VPASSIALLTDFGPGEYAGILRGVLADLAPESRVIDLSHHLPRFSPLSASYVLYSAWDYFPRQTVFCVVVDPGVGSERGLLFAEAGEKRLLAPDNGVVSLLARFKTDLRCCRLLPPRREELPGLAVSATFHGRDILAPAAALAAAGELDRLCGEPLEPQISPQARPEISRPEKQDRLLSGGILHIDHFGNCVSSIHTSDLQSFAGCAGLRIAAGKFTQLGLKSHYAQVERGQPLAYLGSSGFLEIAVREDSAARRLGLSLLDRISVGIAQGKNT
jgi:S-adenosylmethionine hydrolase